MENRYLFRAKRIDNGEWIVGNRIDDGVTGQVFIHAAGNTVNESDKVGEDGCLRFVAFEVDPSTICQCTGLKDMNGKLIWENDIVDFLGHKGKVMYECGSFGIAYRDYIDWEEIEANICPITGCDNALCACENDNFISLWEIYWNFNDEDDSVNTVEVIGSAIDNPESLESEG